MDQTKPDKIRLLSIEQQTAIEHLLQGKSDAATAEAVGVTRQTIWTWRHDPYFAAELNRCRREIWEESTERLKNMAGLALDTLERSLSCGDPKIELAAAQCIMKRVINDGISLGIGPTTPEGVAYQAAKWEASKEMRQKYPGASSFEIEDQIEALAAKKVKVMLKG